MSDHPAVSIRRFQPGDEPAFASLNREWLVGSGLIEPADERQLEDPHTYVFAPGGEIFIACADGMTVGCCAAIPRDPHVIEVAKLAVSPSARGRGIGRTLVHAALRFGRQRHCDRAILTSSTLLVAALRLYESLGFTYRAVPPDVPYATVDVYMELHLDGWIDPDITSSAGTLE